MRIYSKPKEKLLSYIGYQTNPEKGIGWKDILYTYLQSWADWLVSADQIFERGLDVEELTLVMTADKDKAWEAAEPYYNSARFKGHSKAYYRIAMHWAEDDNSEFLYGHYLEGAAKRGYMAAVRDFVKYYDDFKVTTITKNAYRRKRRQEKVYFNCHKILAENKDPDAMWELGTCYLFGTGVKKDVAKGLLIRDCAIETGSLSPEQKESMISTQNIFKSFEVDERSRYTIFTAFKDLFTIKKPDRKVEHQVKDNEKD